MAHLTVQEITGGGRRRYVKVTRGGHRSIVSRPPAGGTLSGLGASGSECGPEPALGPGEKRACCPELGWVIFDGVESSYGICERAAAKSSSGSSSSTTPDLPSDPMERVRAMRLRMEDRRDQREEEQFEQQKQELKLKMIMNQMKAIQRSEAAREQRELFARAARRKAEAKRKRDEENKRLAIAGSIALFGAKLLRLI